ncbi:MAG: DUF3108 domain-containing protein [bacterium]
MILLRRLLLLLIVLLVGSPASAQFSRVESTGDGTMTLTLADTLFLNGQYDAARDTLERWISSPGGQTAVNLYNRGVIARAAGQGTGLGWFRRAYQVSDERFRVSWALGQALTESGSLVEGEGYLREAVDRDKGYYESSVALGHNLRLQKRYDEALTAMRKTFGRDRTYVYAYTEVAKTCLEMSDTLSALQILHEGYAKFPYEQILIEMIRIHQGGNRADSVIVFGKEYLLLYPKGPNLKEIVADLRKADPGTNWHTTGTYDLHPFGPNGAPEDPQESLPINTELQFKVRYGFIGIGDLRIDLLEGEYKGIPCWRARYVARSAPALPFVTIADTFYAYVDRQLRYTIRLEMHYHEMGYKAVKVYESDYENGIFESRIVFGNGLWMIQPHPLPPNVYDATSQLWYAQQLIMVGKGGDCTVELSGGFEKTIIQNLGRDGTVKLNGQLRPQVKLAGIMHYAGIAGLTGEYQGWYSLSPVVWPMMAKFKIFLGWITIEYQDHIPTPLPAGPSFQNTLINTPR